MANTNKNKLDKNMDIRILTRSLLLATILMLSACGDSDNSSNTVKTGIQPTLDETLDQAINANINDNQAGLTVSVWQDGEILYSGMKGLARQDVAIGENTSFRLASVSKVFTAVAVMSLYEQGIINLEDSILNYIPELDESWREISIHYLLSHQSGIPDFYNDLNAPSILPNGITNSNIVNYFSQYPSLEFSPGTGADYSNSGYVLLAEIIERVSSLTFPQFMQEHIFTKLDMHGSYILDENAQYHSDTAFNKAQSPLIYGIEFYASGTASQVSTAYDLGKFFNALLSEQILQPESLELMLTAHADVGGSYGYGIGHLNGSLNVYSHTGLNDGFRSIFVINK